MKHSRTKPLRVLAITACALFAPLADAWDAAGHRTITKLALEGFAQREGTPEFLRDPQIRERVVDQSTTPDRWRGTRVAQLAHQNNPDHYLDIEDLEPYGLTLAEVSPLRYEFIKQLVLAKERKGEAFNGRPINPATDTARVLEWPGFLPHAIMEHWGKLQASFRTLRILEALNEPARAEQLANARLNVMYHMGVLSHFVGDAAQPLHTTTHHHGWVGDNPNNFTTDRGFHAYIDGTIVAHHGISADSLRESVLFDQPLADARDPWRDVLALITRSHEMVTPVYEAQKSGALEQPAGAQLIIARFTDAAATLAALYVAAYEQAAPTPQQTADFIKYDGFAAPTPTPADTGTGK
jgi:hypothetical protein